MKTTELAQLERLVDELMKNKPNQSQVQTYMKMAGLNYSTDPVEQLNSVLSYLQERRNRPQEKTQLKSHTKTDSRKETREDEQII